MLDIRNLNPDIFLFSDDPDELVFSILAGSRSKETRMELIREIFFKLQLILKDDKVILKEKLARLELLSLLRGEETQGEVMREVEKMPVFIDITKDARFKQGLEKGIEKGIDKGAEIGLERGVAQSRREIAAELLKRSLSRDLVKEVTKLTDEQIDHLLKG